MHSPKPPSSPRPPLETERMPAQPAAGEILAGIGITSPALIATVLAHPFPSIVAQGFQLLIQRGYSNLEALEAEPACVYRDALLRVTQSLKGSKDIPVAYFVITCASFSSALERRKASTDTDFIKKILDFLGTKKCKISQPYDADHIVGFITLFLKETPPELLEFAINFFAQSEDWGRDYQVLVSFKKLSIPYTKGNLHFLRTEIPLGTPEAHKLKPQRIANFILLLSLSDLLTLTIFTTLTSEYKAIKNEKIEQNTPLFILVSLIIRILSITKSSPPPSESICFNTENLTAFLQSLPEERRFFTRIFKNLQLLETTPASMSDPGIANVMSYVITKQNIAALDSVIRYLTQTSPEGTASSDVIRRTLCSLPDLEKMVKTFDALCEPNKAYVKKIIIQGDRDHLCKLLCALHKFQGLFENEYQKMPGDSFLSFSLTPPTSLEMKLCRHAAPIPLVTAFEIFLEKTQHLSEPVQLYIPLFTRACEQENPEAFLESQVHLLAAVTPPYTAVARQQAPLAVLEAGTKLLDDDEASTLPSPSVTYGALFPATGLCEQKMDAPPAQKRAALQTPEGCKRCKAALPEDADDTPFGAAASVLDATASGLPSLEVEDDGAFFAWMEQTPLRTPSK